MLGQLHHDPSDGKYITYARVLIAAAIMYRLRVTRQAAAALVSCALLAAPVRAWDAFGWDAEAAARDVLRALGEGSAARFTVVGRRTIPAERLNQARAGRPGADLPAQLVPMALIVEADSRWTRSGALEAALSRASRIFGRCGVGLGEIDVLTVRWGDEAIRDLRGEDHPTERTVMTEPLLPARRPIGFFFQDEESIVPSAFNVKSVETLTRMGKTDMPLLLNTFWLTYEQYRERQPDQDASFNLAAHEIAHLLGNLEHVDEEPNLMSRGRKSGDLAEWQCVEVRKLYGQALEMPAPDPGAPDPGVPPDGPPSASPRPEREPFLGRCPAR